MLETMIRLSPAQERIVEKLKDFEAPYLEERLVGEGMAPGSYQEAFREFKRFVALNALSDEPVAMTSSAVDKVWHQFILFTPQYTEFCDDMLGAYLHHVPETSETPRDREAEANLHSSYEELFGKMPEIWDRKATCPVKLCKGYRS